MTNPLEQAIDVARNGLPWQDDWDGEGSPACTQAAWERAIALVRESCGESADLVPRINPGPEGSIDLQWKGYTVLVNVPSEGAITYYAKGQRGTVKGEFATNDISWLFAWLGVGGRGLATMISPMIRPVFAIEED